MTMESFQNKTLFIQYTVYLHVECEAVLLLFIQFLDYVKIIYIKKKAVWFILLVCASRYSLNLVKEIRSYDTNEQEEQNQFHVAEINSFQVIVIFVLPRLLDP